MGEINQPSNFSPFGGSHLHIGLGCYALLLQRDELRLIFSSLTKPFLSASTEMTQEEFSCLRAHTAKPKRYKIKICNVMLHMNYQ